MITLPTVTICCVCKRVSDKTSGPEEWVKLKTFLDRHELLEIDVKLSHTYCPSCYDRQARAWLHPKSAPSKTTGLLGK
jgi:hypothetical protein